MTARVRAVQLYSAMALTACLVGPVAAEPVVGHYPGGHPFDRVAASDAVRDALEPTAVRLGYIGDFIDIESPGAFDRIRWSLDAVWGTGAVYVLNLMTTTPLQPLAYPTNAAEWTRSNRYYALAATIKAWGEACGPSCHLLIVPYPEHDGDWVAYGQTPRDFIGAFRKLRHVLWQVGALPYTRLVWGPNVNSAAELARYYPGSGATDLVGCSAYKDLAHVRMCVEHLRVVAPGKKILLTQTGACAPGNGAWTRSLVRYLLQQPDVLGALLFEYDKECDWRLGDGWREAVTDLDPRVRR